MRNALTVASKEFRTFFQTPIGYVILFVFTLVAGWLFFYTSGFFTSREASMRALFYYMPWLFLVLAPAITMRLWAEEKKTGTVEVLLTMPIKEGEVVLGKFLAASALILLWLVSLLPILGVVMWLGEPDMGPVWGGFIGAFLLGCAYVAMGVAASALTENQIISLVLAFAGGFFFMLVGFQPVVEIFPEMLGAFLHNLSLNTHFTSIMRGVIDLRDVLFYVTFVGFFLYVNRWAVRRESGGGLSLALVAGILICVNVLSGSVSGARFDLTDDKRYTLGDDTKRILARLDDDLRMTAYLSSDLPSSVANLRRDVQDLIGEFESFAGGRLRVEVINPDRSEELREQARSAQVPDLPVGGSSATSLEVKKAFLGITMEFRDKSETIQAIRTTENLEYELMLRIDKITRSRPVEVAFQLNNAMAGMQIPGMPRPPGGQDRHSPEQDMRVLNEALRMQFEATTVDLNDTVKEDVSTILLVNGEMLTEKQKYYLDQFLMRGGSLIVMASGNEPSSFGSQGPAQSPFMRGPVEMSSADLFSHYGFTVNGDVVMDKNCAEIPMPAGTVQTPFGPMQVQEPVAYLPIPIALADSINQEHPISAGLGSLVFLFPSSVETNAKPGVAVTELVKTSSNAEAKADPFMMLNHEQLPDPETFEGQFVLAALLEGEFHSYYVGRDLPQEIVASLSDGDAEPGMPGPGGLDLSGTTLPTSQFPIPGSNPPAPIPTPIPTPDTVLAKEKEAADQELGEALQESNPEVQGEGGGAEEPKAEAEDDEGGDSAAEGDDIPGGGLVRSQDAGEEEAAAETASGDDQSVREELGFLGKSPPNTRILVVGTNEFATDQTRGSGNHLFMLNAVDFLSTDENLSGLRVKNMSSRRFPEVEGMQKSMSLFAGMYLGPLILAILGFWVYIWRRVLRPAKARRAMNA
jgi:ABC-2 type transport system permease protein